MRAFRTLFTNQTRKPDKNNQTRIKDMSRICTVCRAVGAQEGPDKDDFESALHGSGRLRTVSLELSDQRQCMYVLYSR